MAQVATATSSIIQTHNNQNKDIVHGGDDEILNDDSNPQQGCTPKSKLKPILRLCQNNDETTTVPPPIFPIDTATLVRNDHDTDTTTITPTLTTPMDRNHPIATSNNMDTDTSNRHGISNNSNREPNESSSSSSTPPQASSTSSSSDTTTTNTTTRQQSTTTTNHDDTNRNITNNNTNSNNNTNPNHTKNNGSNNHTSPSSSNHRKVTPPTVKDHCKIFVGGLPSDVTLDEFRTFFEQFGTVIDSIIMYDRITTRSRGFGFITYDNPMTCQLLISKKKLLMRQEKYVEIKPAEPKLVVPSISTSLISNPMMMTTTTPTRSSRSGIPTISNGRNNNTMNHIPYYPTITTIPYTSYPYTATPYDNSITTRTNSNTIQQSMMTMSLYDQYNSTNSNISTTTPIGDINTTPSTTTGRTTPMTGSQNINTVYAPSSSLYYTSPMMYNYSYYPISYYDTNTTGTIHSNISINNDDYYYTMNQNTHSASTHPSHNGMYYSPYNTTSTTTTTTAATTNYPYHTNYDMNQYSTYDRQPMYPENDTTTSTTMTNQHTNDTFANTNQSDSNYHHNADTMDHVSNLEENNDNNKNTASTHSPSSSSSSSSSSP